MAPVSSSLWMFFDYTIERLVRPMGDSRFLASLLMGTKGTLHIKTILIDFLFTNFVYM